MHLLSLSDAHFSLEHSGFFESTGQFWVSSPSLLAEPDCEVVSVVRIERDDP